MSNKSDTSAQIVIQDPKNETLDKIKINGSSTIEFQNISNALTDNGSVSKSKSPISILLKSPQIEVDEKARFTTFSFWWHFLDSIHHNVQGLKAKLNFIDDYSEPYGNGTKVRYLTFMNISNDLG